MAEWTSVAVQTVNPGEAIVFTDTAQSCPMGYILHREDSGAFLMKGIDTGSCIRRCCCKEEIHFNDSCRRYERLNYIEESLGDIL